jgi:MoaA/NifB/PqqE/SkfB family radical SAM enzyme
MIKTANSKQQTANSKQQTYIGDNFFRYLNLLRKANFGISIRKIAIINYIKIKCGFISERVGNKSTYPAIIQMYSLRRCNQKCSFCNLGYFGLPSDWDKHELTPSKFKEILSLDILKKALVICFTGGEPLLNKDMPKLIKMAKANKFIVGMITNGLLLEERLEEIKDIGIADIQLSVYENTKEQLRKILPNVSQYFPLNATYVLPKSQLINRENFKELVDTIKMCMTNGCASFKFNICHPNGLASDLSETIYENDAVYDNFVEFCKSELMDVNFIGYSTKKKIIPSKKFTVFLPYPIMHDSSLRNCSQPWTLFPISTNGDFGLCCGKSFLGNIFDDKSTINNEKAKSIRRSIIDHSLPMEKECKNCIFRNGAYSSNF